MCVLKNRGTNLRACVYVCLCVCTRTRARLLKSALQLVYWLILLYLHMVYASTTLCFYILHIFGWYVSKQMSLSGQWNIITISSRSALCRSTRSALYTLSSPFIHHYHHWFTTVTNDLSSSSLSSMTIIHHPNRTVRTQSGNCVIPSSYIKNQTM